VMRPSLKRARRHAAVAVLLLAASACRGPEAALNVGMNAKPVDLLLGQRIRVVTGGVAPPVSTSFAPTGYLDGAAAPAKDVPVHVPSRTSGTSPCPSAPVDAAILTPKTPAPPGPPSAATYTYRVKGSIRVGGAERALPGELTRDVVNIRSEPPAAFAFDTFDTMGGQTSATTYRVVPGWYPVQPPTSNGDIAKSAAETQTGQQIPNSPTASRAEPGLYILRFAAGDAGFRVSDPGIKLVDFPVELGATFTSAATDGVTTMNYTSTVNPVPTRVNACGILLDVYQVDLAGHISKSTSEDGYVDAPFTASYGIAPQFGGLVVWEKIQITSADVSRTMEATINQEPARPGPGGPTQ
jgi:hypothetical protein